MVEQQIQAVLLDYGDTLAHFGPVDDALLVAYEQIREKLIAAGKPALDGKLSVPVAHVLLEGVSQRFVDLLNRSYEEERIEELDAAELFRGGLEALGLLVDDALLEEIILAVEEVGYALRERAPEADEVSATLRARGLKLGLVSNYCSLPSVVRRHAIESELLQLVDASIFSCEIGLRKPHPRIYQTVLARLDVPPEAVVFVGDRLREDVMGPKALGMRAILTHQFRQEDPAQARVPPDAVVTRLAELPNVLEGWLTR
ncbi:MAG TPA: HAD family hydrolase [Ktedonobacterales bacterium]|nr:HAD family hydrolase [Ktedonobacterales bacterium]